MRYLAASALGVLSVLVSGAARAQDFVVTGKAGGPADGFLYNPTGFNGSFSPYAGFQGGMRVAAGDITGDGYADIIVGAGPGAGPHVKALDGQTGAEIRSFFAFAPNFTGGVTVAAGDVNGDGRADIVVGADAGGGPQVRVFDGVNGNEIASFFAFGAGFTGGVRVAAGDVDGDGKADIIAGTASGGSEVRVFSGATQALLNSFNPYSAGFTGGVTVAAGDVNGDGKADIITGSASSASHVKAFDSVGGGTLLSFLAFGPSSDGVFVGAYNRPDGFRLLAGSGIGVPNEVRTFDASSNLLGTANPFTDYRLGVEVGGAPIPVPEPATLLGIGAGLLALRRRKRVSSSQP